MRKIGIALGLFIILALSNSAWAATAELIEPENKGDNTQIALKSLEKTKPLVSPRRISRKGRTRPTREGMKKVREMKSEGAGSTKDELKSHVGAGEKPSQVMFSKYIDELDKSPNIKTLIYVVSNEQFEKTTEDLKEQIFDAFKKILDREIGATHSLEDYEKINLLMVLLKKAKEKNTAWGPDKLKNIETWEKQIQSVLEELNNEKNEKLKSDWVTAVAGVTTPENLKIESEYNNAILAGSEASNQLFDKIKVFCKEIDGKENFDPNTLAQYLDAKTQKKYFTEDQLREITSIPECIILWETRLKPIYETRNNKVGKTGIVLSSESIPKETKVQFDKDIDSMKINVEKKHPGGKSITIQKKIKVQFGEHANTLNNSREILNQMIGNKIVSDGTLKIIRQILINVFGEKALETDYTNLDTALKIGTQKEPAPAPSQQSAIPITPPQPLPQPIDASQAAESDKIAKEAEQAKIAVEGQLKQKLTTLKQSLTQLKDELKTLGTRLTTLKSKLS